MKICAIFTGFFSLLFGVFLNAGDPVPAKGCLVLDDDHPQLVTLSLDSRLRYEYGEINGLDVSHAGTLRNRIGLLTRKTAGFQFFAEYEGTLAADRNSYRAALSFTDRSTRRLLPIRNRTRSINCGAATSLPTKDYFSKPVVRQSI